MILLFYLDSTPYLTKSSVARRFFPNPAKDFQVLEVLVTCPKKFQFIVRDIMPDPLPATDIQIVRLQLQLLCSRQSDPAVRYYGAIVDFNLARALIRDDPIQRAELANYVEEFRMALCRPTAKKPATPQALGQHDLPRAAQRRQRNAELFQAAPQRSTIRARQVNHNLVVFPVSGLLSRGQSRSSPF